MLQLDGLGYRGKTVVITGGASGMGEQVARILGELGAKVALPSGVYTGAIDPSFMTGRK